LRGAGVIAALLLFLSPAVLAGGASPIALRAFVGDQLAWKAEIHSLAPKGNQACSVVYWKSAAEPGPAVKLLVRECAELQNLLRPGRKFQTDALVVRSDEPRYEFEIGRKKYAVNFEAPSRCEIQDSGALGCKDQPLTDLQSALLILRAHAPR